MYDILNQDSSKVEFPVEAIMVSDPPYNIGYHYDVVKDKLKQSEFFDQLAHTMRSPCVIIGYPEMIFRFAARIQEIPKQVVAWVYNANTPRQWRTIAYFGIKPDFSDIKQPFKNPNDKRIKVKIAAGKKARLYDWWEIQQVKNVSKTNSSHPCQMPLEVMERIVRSLPIDKLIIDPYAGSGTTIVAAKKWKRQAIGYELSYQYIEEAMKRIQETTLCVGEYC